MKLSSEGDALVGRRSGAHAFLFGGAAVVIAVAVVVLRPPKDVRRLDLLRRAAALANRSDRLTPRLAGVPGAPFLAAGVIAWGRRTTNATAAALSELTRNDRSPAGLHDAGVAYFLGGEPLAAAEHLRQAASREDHAGWWSDVAAAEIALGDATHDCERYLAALVAADRALSLDRTLAEAHFNRALIVERLGFARASLRDWMDFVRVSGDDRSRPLVENHILAVRHTKTARDEWAAANKRLAAISRPELERMTDAYPQEARTWAESMILTAWAEHVIADDGQQNLYLERVRLIANRLALRNGERLLADAVGTIERAREQGTAHDVRALAQAQLEYYAGRVAFKEGRLHDARRRFESARRQFSTRGSAMAAVAEMYSAMAEIRLNRLTPARALLTDLQRHESKDAGHLALISQVKYLSALCDGMNANWGDALRRATEARDGFECLGEMSQMADAEMLVADALAFLGQPQLAWRHLVDASVRLSMSGEWDRLQVCAAAMNQVELRRHEWLTATSVSAIEVTLGTDPELLSHAYLRAASAADQLGRPAAAFAALRKADEHARRVVSVEARDKLLADVAAVDGRVLTAGNPSAAEARLTESLRYQKRAGRLFAVPWLCLDRGRAHVRMGADDAAIADFDEGIRALESQRKRVPEDELRAGLFDDAGALFGEAAAVALRRGDIARAFRDVERGRARALLDEMAEPAGGSSVVDVRTLQSVLPPGALLVSYAILPEGLAIFVAGRRSLNVRFSRVSADDLAADVATLFAAVDEPRRTADIAAKLYDALITPIEDDVSRATRLIIVPDPVLESVPYAALLNRATHRYLIETHEVSMVPSAAVFVACSRRARALATAPASPERVAVFANPATPPEESVPFLSAADAEANGIGKIYRDSQVWRRGAASSERFVRESGTYAIVQFSGHTRIDKAEPWKSALLFEREVSADEIARLRFSSTRLVILAGCTTLASDANRVESTASIGRAFLSADVPAVLGTLWDVDDEDAAIVIRRVHKLLARGIGVTAALRRVQCDLLREDGGARVDRWAAFTVLGVDRAQ